MRLEDNITNIKGIGDKKAENFSRLGINTIKDLIFYYPRSYKNYSPAISVNKAPGGKESLFLLKL